jgi:hypothetical protein
MRSATARCEHLKSKRATADLPKAIGNARQNQRAQAITPAKNIARPRWNNAADETAPERAPQCG